MKLTQHKPTRLAARKSSIFIHKADGSVHAYVLKADDVVEQHVSKTLAGNALSSTERKTRSVRASHVERDLAELKKVVAALAVRSVAHEDNAVSFDTEGMTVLDADTAYQLVDNPPEPSDALRKLLALR